MRDGDMTAKRILKDINKIELEEMFKEKKKKTMDFSIIDVLFVNTCKNFINDNKRNLMIAYKNMRSYVRNRLDVVFYIKAIEKLELLKLITLSKENGMSLNLLKKPNIADMNDMKAINADLVNNTADDAFEIIHYYLNKNKGSNLTQRDIDIYNFLDPIIKNFVGKLDSSDRTNDKIEDIPSPLKKNKNFGKKK
jgi:hypothetical protein